MFQEELPMARGVNKVILIGNVGGDPETRYMPNGNAVTNITLATTDSWKDKQTGQLQERTEWHRVVLFGKVAEIAGEYLRKGSQCYIEGRLQTREWEKDGVKRYTTEIVVDMNGTMQLLGGRTGLAHFAAGLQCHHAEGGSRALALADHVEVADLEDAKAQQALGKKDAAQREKRQGVQCGMGGHVMGGMRQLSSHAVPRPAGRGPIFLSQSYNAMLFQIVSFLLDVVVGLLTGVCLLRMYMQAQRIPFGNPVGQLVFALSDWIVMPLRRVIKPAGRWDMSSLIAAFLLQMLQFVLLWLLMGGQSNVLALPWLALCGLARVALSGMVGVLLIYVILSWVQPQSPMYGVLQRLSEPMLRPIRRIVPLIGGIDLSALVALVLLQIALMVLGYIQGSGLMLLA